MKKIIFSKAESLEPTTLPKVNFFIGILQGFYCEFYLATFRTAIFKNNFSSRTPSPLLKHQLLTHDLYTTMTAVS